MRLTNSLRTECGTKGFLLTTLCYNKRLKKQAAKLEEQRKQFEYRQKVIREERAEAAYREKRAEEMEKLLITGPNKYMSSQQQMLMSQVQQYSTMIQNRITGIYY